MFLKNCVATFIAKISVILRESFCTETHPVVSIIKHLLPRKKKNKQA